MSEYRRQVTQQRAKSIGGMLGFAGQQANAAGRRDGWTF